MRIYKGYHVAVRTNSNQFGPVQFKAVSLSQNAQTATDSPVFCGSVQSSCSLFAVATTGPSNTRTRVVLEFWRSGVSEFWDEVKGGQN